VISTYQDELNAQLLSFETKEASLRQTLNAQHRIELEKVAEKHKTRMHLMEVSSLKDARKMFADLSVFAQAEIQAHYDGEMKRMKALHQQVRCPHLMGQYLHLYSLQEIERLIREVTRYKGLSVRKGPTTPPLLSNSCIPDSVRKVSLLIIA
jgi:ribosomal protein RSM22 (predicted rRNA methylase)